MATLTVGLQVIYCCQDDRFEKFMIEYITDEIKAKIEAEIERIVQLDDVEFWGPDQLIDAISWSQADRDAINWSQTDCNEPDYKACDYQLRRVEC